MDTGAVGAVGESAARIVTREGRSGEGSVNSSLTLAFTLMFLAKDMQVLLVSVTRTSRANVSTLE